jgi:hypothetical protein
MVLYTVQWEGYREGIDDMRYLATLQRELDAAKKNVKTQSKKTAIAAAEGFISNLKTMNLEQIQPDVLRKDMISHILALKGLKTEEWLSVPAGR